MYLMEIYTYNKVSISKTQIIFFSVGEVSAIVAVPPCSRFYEDFSAHRSYFQENTFIIEILERGCPRSYSPVNLDIPYLKSARDIVPFLVDIRSDNRLIEKWDDIVILHDDSIGKIIIIILLIIEII